MLVLGWFLRSFPRRLGSQRAEVVRSLMGRFSWLQIPCGSPVTGGFLTSGAAFRTVRCSATPLFAGLPNGNGVIVVSITKKQRSIGWRAQKTSNPLLLPLSDPHPPKLGVCEKRLSCQKQNSRGLNKCFCCVNLLAYLNIKSVDWNR